MHHSYSYDITHNLQYNMAKMLRPTQGPLPPPDAYCKQKLVFFECSLEEEDSVLSSTPKEAEVMSDFISTQASFSPTVEYGLTTEKNSNGVCIFFSLFF